MYRLTYFKATNVIGFISGLSRKTVEIDLTKFIDKDLIIIFGDNASGKSTFMSLVHPWHTPTDGRTKFIVPGKEGTLLREYLSDDGTLIQTKCVYTPKKDKEGHNAKCYFSIVRPGKDKPEELNPTGNIPSYQALLYTYFNLNKEFIGFATYNPTVASIVKQSHVDRKNSVGAMVPNTSKFEVSYSIINERYKELRTLIRNISDKMLHMRDEDSIRGDLKRIQGELKEARDTWKEASDKLARAEGRLKELTHGDSADDMVDRYNKLIESIHSCDRRIQDLRSRMKPVYEKLGIKLTDDNIGIASTSDVTSKVVKYERQLAKVEAAHKNNESQLNQLQSQLYRTEDEIMKLTESLGSMNTRDLSELNAILKSYQDELNQMEYAKNPKQYTDMSYDEIVTFSKTVSMLHVMIQALYDTYGELVTQYFNNKLAPVTQDTYQALHCQIETNNAKLNQLYMEFLEKDQYKRFKSILEQRPKTCQIDTCPFIATALKWSKVADEAEEIKKQYDKLSLDIIAQQDQLKSIGVQMELSTQIETLTRYISQYSELFQKYFHLTIEDIYRSIETSSWMSVLDIMKLKSLAVILSEKDRYQEITTICIPEIQHAKEMTELYGANRQLLETQLSRLKDDRKQIKDSISQYKLHLHVSETMREYYQEILDGWKTVGQLVDEYKEIVNKRIEAAEQADKQIDIIHHVEELREKIRKHKSVIAAMDEIIAERSPKEHQLHVDVTTLLRLKAEKSQIELNFVIVDIIRSILLPGKGIRKELINIYMYDIYKTANQLLLHTFNGNLYLKEFVITDKEFIIPYVYNGTVSPDVALASSSQQSAIAISISMAILSKVLSNYGIVCFDEADAAFSPANREIFIDILTTQLSFIGIKQAFFITHHPGEYSGYHAGFLQFPGGTLKGHEEDKIII